MTQRNWSWEAKQLLPHLAGMLGGGVTVQSGGGGGLVAHALNSATWHTGTLAEAQAPWAVTYTVYDAHLANTNAHHARQHALSDSAAHSGLLPWTWLDKAGASLADLPTRLYADLQSRAHSIVGGDHTIPGGDWDVVINVGTGTPGLRTPSYDVSGGQTALLRSFLGALTVNSITAAGASPKVRTPLIDTLSGDLALSPQSGWVTTGALSASGRLRSPLLDTASGNMAISPAIDVVLSPIADVVLNPGGWVELTNGKTLRTQSFASGFVGNGFRIDQGVSVAGQTSLEVDNVWVRGRMHVYELLIHQIRATNGSIFVSNTGKVTVVSGTGPYTLTTDPEHGFAVGDLIRAQRFTGTGVYQSNLQVTSVTNTKVFVATLASGNAPAAGMDFVRLGSASDANRRGGLYLTADDSGAPFMDIFDGVTSFATWGTAGVIKTRLGKLDGLGLPGSYSGEYGLYAGNGTTDASAYIRLSNKTNRLNNLPLEWWSAGSKAVSIDSTDGLVMQTAAVYTDQRSVTWKSGATKIGDAAAYSNPGVGRQVGLAVYQSSAADLSVLYLNATNTSSKWPYVVLTAQRNTAGTPEAASLYVGRVESLAFTGVYADADMKVAGTLAVTSTLDVTGSAAFSSSLTAALYGSFNSGKVVAQWNAPYYGISVSADVGAWARLHGFHTTGGALLGGLWAYGPGNSVEYWAIGTDYTTNAHLKMWRASKLSEFAGQITAASGSQAAPGYAFTAYPDTGMYAVAGPEVVLAAGGTYNAIFGNTRLLLRVGASNVLISGTTGDAYMALGSGRTANGASYVDLHSDTVAGYDARLIRWGGVNGAMELWQTGTGLLRIGTLQAADFSILTSSAIRMTFDSAGEITNYQRHNGPTFNATTSLQRSGVAGGIFVPVSARYLTDTGSVQWAGGASKAVGTYYFNMTLATNGTIPAAAYAVALQISGVWSTGNNGYYTTFQASGAAASTASGVLRGIVSGMASDQFTIVPTNVDGWISAIVAGATMNSGAVRLIGYFI